MRYIIIINEQRLVWTSLTTTLGPVRNQVH